jgi:hypothetical protein
MSLIVPQRVDAAFTSTHALMVFYSSLSYALGAWWLWKNLTTTLQSSMKS